MFWYYGVNFGFSFALVLVAAGVAVIAIGVLGHRARPGDIALFIVALLVLAAVASSNYTFTSGTEQTFSATPSQVSSSHIAVLANTNFGSITINLSNNASLAYRVVFGKTFSFPFFSFNVGNQSKSFTNKTRNGVLILNATSSTQSITITLGAGYQVDVNATAGTGSITIDSASRTQKLGVVYATTGTGSISATIDSSNLSYLYLNGGTGSINLQSDYLSPSGRQVPISISTGTGSLNCNVNVPNNVAVDLSASNGFGSISKNLQGFTISESTNNQLKASLGDTTSASRSFVMDLSVGTGSLNINVATVAP